MKTITITYDDITTSIDWSDNVTPLEALGILRYHEKNVYAGLLNYNLSLETEKTPKQELYIRDLDMSVRLYNCLRRNGVETLADIEKLNERDLLMFRNMGKTSVQELKYILKEHNLKLNEK